MSQLTPARMATAAFVAVALIACGGDDGPADVASTQSTTEAADATSSTTTTEKVDDLGCGVTLEEVQALLPPSSGVTENSTPDAGRCNFTWDEGGPRGIDVAIVTGGRASFSVPAGYEQLEGYGDEAFGSFESGRASAVAFLGDDLHAADVVADGTGSTEAELRDLCLQVLEKTLD